MVKVADTFDTFYDLIKVFYMNETIYLMHVANDIKTCYF